MELYGLVWPCLAFYGLIWHVMVFYDRISSFLAVIDPNSFDLVFVRSILATFRTLDMNQKLKLEPKQKLAYEFEVTRKILNLFFGSKTLHDCEPV